MWYENKRDRKCIDLISDLDYSRSEYNRLRSDLGASIDELYRVRNNCRDEISRIQSSCWDEICEYNEIISQKDQEIIQKSQEIETLKQKILDQEKRIHLLSYNRKIV